MRHPCIICEDVGTYEFESRLYVCDCEVGRRLQRQVELLEVTANG